jgi:hypothetical protein
MGNQSNELEPKVKLLQFLMSKSQKIFWAGRVGQKKLVGRTKIFIG